ncbi:LysE family translocator [Notoacmeibacter ruber]|uniref:LysE family translocator n=1 Tax=Notoacmeibacter ruber TaxID=2670375 RepID=A0A3L7J8S2_9HYPH|nr:LysE family translocator [Notoacmeibacter ruber]RLQ86889.1 LysE family translocator [Notoacmeibacter ruber]
MTPEFIITALIVVAAPGTGAIFTMAAGLSRGPRAALVAAFGCMLGILPHMAAAITGLAALLHASALAFEVIKYAGVVYLLYMAWQTLKTGGPLTVESDGKSKSDRQVILSAILINVLNPKLSIFFFAFLPQFVEVETAGALPQMIELSTIFMMMTFVVFACYGVFAATVRQRLLSSAEAMTWLRRSFAAVFVGLGVRLALAER